MLTIVSLVSIRDEDGFLYVSYSGESYSLSRLLIQHAVDLI